MMEAGKFSSKVSFNLLINELNKKGMVLNACYMYCLAFKCGAVTRNKHEVYIFGNKISIEDSYNRLKLISFEVSLILWQVLL